MKRLLRSARKILACLAFLLTLLLAGILMMLRCSSILQRVVPWIAEKQGFQVEFTSASIDLLRGIEITGLTIHGGSPQLDIKNCDLFSSWKISALLKKQIFVESLLLDGCAIHLPPPTPTATSSTKDKEPTASNRNSSGWTWQVAQLLIPSLDFSLASPSLSIRGLSLQSQHLGSSEISSHLLKIKQLAFQQGSETRVSGPFSLRASLPGLDFRSERFNLELNSPKLALAVPQTEIREGVTKLRLRGDSFSHIQCDLETQALALGGRPDAPTYDLALHLLFETPKPGHFDFSVQEFRIGTAETPQLAIKGQVRLKLPKQELEVQISELGIRDELIAGYLPQDTQLPRFHISGNHHLGLHWNPLRVDSSGQFNLDELSSPLLNPEVGSLRGSNLAYAVKLADGQLQCSTCTLALTLADNPVGSLSLSGNLTLPQEEGSSLKGDLSLQTIGLQVDKLLSIPQQPATPASAEATPPSEVEAPVEPVLPELNFSLNMQDSHYLQLPLGSVEATLHTSGRRAELNNLTVRHEAGKLTASGFMETEGARSFQLQALSSGLDLRPFLIFLFPEHEKALKGRMQDLSLQISGKLQNLTESLRGKFVLHAKEVTLPSKLQQHPPLNLLFLPFNVLADGLGNLSGFLLPDSVNGVSSELRGMLDEQGRMEINSLILDLEAKDGNAIIHKVQLDPYLLPKVRINGRISFAGDLNLHFFLSVLEATIPLPVTGTLDLPLPDIVSLVPDLVQGLGLSLLDVAAAVTGDSESSEDSANSEALPTPEASPSEASSVQTGSK